MTTRKIPGCCTGWVLVTLASGVVLFSVIAGVWADEASVAKTGGPMNGMSVTRDQHAKEYRVLWPGHRIFTGTIESIQGDVIKVNTGELQPRFLSLKEAKEKGLSPLKQGDRVQLVVNDQNIVVDYHPAGQGIWHRIIRGQLAQPLPVGQEWAVIRTEEGKEEAFYVRPLARAKVSAIPVGASAVFFTDEGNKVIDATFGSEDVLQHKTSEWKKSPPKHPYRRVEGTVVRSPGLIIVKTLDGKEQMFEVRPYVQEKLANAGEGQGVVLLLDDEDKVSDVARPPS